MHLSFKLINYFYLKLTYFIPIEVISNCLNLKAIIKYFTAR